MAAWNGSLVSLYEKATITGPLKDSWTSPTCPGQSRIKQSHGPLCENEASWRRRGSPRKEERTGEDEEEQGYADVMRLIVAALHCARQDQASGLVGHNEAAGTSDMCEE